MREFRIAVCLYGQARTGTYCAPWIKQTFDAFTAANIRVWDKVRPWDNARTEDVKFSVDYFLDIKPHSLEANSPDQTTVIVGDSELNHIIREYHPKVATITTDEQDKSIRNLHRSFYAPAMFSLSRAVLNKQEYELREGISYDMVFVGRFDSLVGPDPKSLFREIQRSGIFPLTLYSYSENDWRFANEAFRSGFSDIFFFGDNLTVDLTIAGLHSAWATHRRNSLVAHNIGPNCLLSRVVSNCGLTYRRTPLEVAIVRMNSDMSKSVFDSFQYHAAFWLNNHLGLNND